MDGQDVAAVTALGDRCFADGLLAKAAAFYKKAQRLKPGDEHSLLQLGEISARQGLLADAKAYFRQLAEQRRARGDERGLAECLTRLARVLRDTSAAFEKQGRRREALDTIAAAAKLDPTNVDFLMVLARLEVEQGGDAGETVLRILALAPQRHREVVPLCQWLAAAGHTESAQACLDALADLALLEGEPEQAAEGIRRLLQPDTGLPAEAGSHVPAETGSREKPDSYVASGFSRKDDESVSRKDDDELPGEVDLSELLAGLEEPAPAAAPTPEGPPDLETVFADIRTRVVQEQQVSGVQLYHRGLDRIVGGDVDGAIADLRDAARIPLFRFPASAQLARLFLEQNDLARAVEWFERAAEAPAPAPEDGHAVLYDLADALDRQGEAARALAVLIELDANAAGYRDVRSRIEQLSRTQA